MAIPTDTNLDAALAYARLGWRVFPCHTPKPDGSCDCNQAGCKSPGKCPRTKHGFKEATTDEAKVREWWATWPHANVAIATGAESNLVVVDVDPKDGGAESFAALPGFARTVEVITGGAGRHLFFVHPGIPVRPVTANNLRDPPFGPGIDVRGDGGYVIAPPSLHPSGRRWEWEASSEPGETEIAPLPAWFLERLPKKNQAPGPSDAEASTRKYSEGRRHRALLTKAGRMRKVGLSVKEIEAALAAFNADRCEPPCEDWRVTKIARYAGNWKSGTPLPAEIELEEEEEEQSAAANDDPGDADETTATAEPVADVDPLDSARSLVTALGERAKNDPGSAFEPQTLGALALLREQDPGAWVNARAELQKAKVPMRDLERAVKGAGPHLRVVDGGDVPELPLVGDQVKSAPEAAQNLRVPRGYYLSPSETGQVRQGVNPMTGEPMPPERAPLAEAPVVLLNRLRNVDDGTEALRVAWRRPQGWHEEIVGREQVVDARKLLDTMAAKAFPVGSHNAKDMARYLHRFEAENFADLAGPRISSHLGWQGRKGANGFLVGRTYVREGGEPIQADIRELPPEGWKSDWVLFRGLDSGDDQLADAFRVGGTWEGWLAAAALAAGRPRVALALYAAFVPPLLEIVGCPNFIVDWAGRTSQGKTTCLRLAASVWGCPDERTPASVVQSWDSTRVASERMGAMVSGLPLILDDSKRARNERGIAEVLYTVANGRGRARGTTKSLGATKAWRTVLLSSGEAKATSYTEDGGTRARVIEVTGQPFGGEGRDAGRVVDQINAGVVSNYGHAGIRFVQALQRAQPRWPDLATETARYASELATTAPNAVVARMAVYASALRTAGQFAHAALGLPFKYVDPMDELWPEIVAAGEDAPPEVRAIRDLASWCFAHEETFLDREATDSRGERKVPNGGWSGYWPKSATWKFVGLFPHKAKEVLTSLGYEAEAVLEGAKGRGWLKTDEGEKRNTYRVKVRGENHRMVAITAAAFVAVGATEDDLPPEGSTSPIEAAGSHRFPPSSQSGGNR